MKNLLDLTPPFMEVNLVPSKTTIADPSGMAANLPTKAPSEPHYDGVKVSELRQLSDLYHHDKIDGVAIATSRLAKNMSDYKKSEFHKEFTKRITAPRKK